MDNKTFISKRLRVLIDRARIQMIYTRQDFQVLLDILKAELARNHTLEMRELVKNLKEFVANGNIELRELPCPYILSIGQYLLLYYRRIFLFLYCIEKERVPLYMNTDLGVFVMWRMKIGK